MTGRRQRPCFVTGLVWDCAMFLVTPALVRSNRSATLTVALCFLAASCIIYVQMFHQVALRRVHGMTAKEKAKINTRTSVSDDGGQAKNLTMHSTVQPAYAHCHLWKKGIDANSSISSQIKLDPGKFLYPGLVGGPNNQIVGLFQSIYLAIRLNRTLVLPTFYEHLKVLRGHIPPEQFIDVERLAAFVSVVPVEQFREACNGSFQVVLKAMENTLEKFRAYKMATGMKLPGHIETLPGKQYHVTYKPWLSSDSKTLNRVYNTSASCALYSAPFQSFKPVGFEKFSQPLRSPFSAAVSDKELYLAAIHSVQRPPAVVEVVKRYINVVYGGESYVAVHWRFDEHDWRGGLDCKRFVRRSDTNLLAPCLDLPKITAADVATGIASSLDKNNVSRSAWRHVYIAAFPTLRAFADDVAQELRKVNEHVVATKTPSLEEFLNEHYGTCWNWAGWKNKKETLGLAEVELLSNSEWFFYSSHSSFSGTALTQRWEMGKDGIPAQKYSKSVLHVADDAYKDRVGRN